eukprot:PhM_4_TR9799/c1_g1_i1/m.24043
MATSSTTASSSGFVVPSTTTTTASTAPSVVNPINALHFDTTTTSWSDVPIAAPTPAPLGSGSKTASAKSLKAGMSVLSRITADNSTQMAQSLISDVLPDLMASASDPTSRSFEKFIDVFVQKGVSDRLLMGAYANVCAILHSSGRHRTAVHSILNHLRSLLFEHRTIAHTSFYAHLYCVNGGGLISDDEVAKFVTALLHGSGVVDDNNNNSSENNSNISSNNSCTPLDAHELERLVSFLRVASSRLEQRLPELALAVSSALNKCAAQQRGNPRLCALINGVLDASQVVPSQCVLSECRTLQERRDTALILLNQALQRTNNTSYAACRRAVDKFCTEHRFDTEDKKLMQVYLSEYLLAGNTLTPTLQLDKMDEEPPAQQEGGGQRSSARPPSLNASLMMARTMVPSPTFNTTDRVKVRRANGEEQNGMVKFIGVPDFTNKGAEFGGTWLGIALDAPKGNHDGCVDGVRYFHCWKGHGIFVRPDTVTLIPDEALAGPVFYYPQDKTGTVLRFDVRKVATEKFMGFCHGDRISTPDGRTSGVVVGVRYGLLFWHMDGADGASACRDNANEAVQALRKKKYKVVARGVSLKNHVGQQHQHQQHVEDGGGSETPRRASSEPIDDPGTTPSRSSSSLRSKLWRLMGRRTSTSTKGSEEQTHERVRHLVSQDSPSVALASPPLSSYYYTSRTGTPVATPTHDTSTTFGPSSASTLSERF